MRDRTSRRGSRASACWTLAEASTRPAALVRPRPGRAGTGELLGDLFALDPWDPAGPRWSNLTADASGDAPSPRSSPGFACAGGRLYVHSGNSDAGASRCPAPRCMGLPLRKGPLRGCAPIFRAAAWPFRPRDICNCTRCDAPSSDGRLGNPTRSRRFVPQRQRMYAVVAWPLATPP